MLRKVATKVVWVGRTASMVFGLALVLALVVGVASMALADNGQPFLLGRLTNTATALTKLTGNVNGSAMQVVNNNAGTDDTALSLDVQRGEAPMRVNSGTKVDNLNADKLDGKDATEIGVNGLERSEALSSFDSNSFKSVTAFCPPGKNVIGTGNLLAGNYTRGVWPNEQTDVVIHQVFPGDRHVTVVAHEEEPTTAIWAVHAIAICAKAP